MFVQLECLNFLRQQTYREEYDYSRLPGFQNSSEQVMDKVDGCIRRLRQAIMCDSDVTPWLLTIHPGTNSPDLDTLHYCRNHEHILNTTKSLGASEVNLQLRWLAGPA